MQKNIMAIIGKYAGNYKHLINLGRALAAISALMMLVPYTLIWKIIRVVVSDGDMNTIANADKVVVLKDGIVAEQGKPSDLLEKESIYKHMISLQRSSMEWKFE